MVGTIEIQGIDGDQLTGRRTAVTMPLCRNDNQVAMRCEVALGTRASKMKSKSSCALSYELN